MAFQSGTEHWNWQDGRSKVGRKCEYCGKTFVARPYDRGKFCSMHCRAQFYAEDTEEFTVCEHCGKRFRKRRKDQPSRFCSRTCQHLSFSGVGHPNWKAKSTFVCEQCGIEFDRLPSYPKYRNHLFCSLQCRYKWHGLHILGTNAPGWRGGISFGSYAPSFNRTLKEQIRERDHYTCAVCRLHGTQVHHINYDKKDSRTENLITLCRHCHSATNSVRSYWQHVLSELLTARLIGTNL